MPESFSRRTFFGLAGLTCLGGPNALIQAANATEKQVASPSAEEVLQDLLDGNARFASGKLTAPRRSPQDFSALTESQAPEAAIIACADSRVPPEILFDQGVGDLFVIRVAGNVVNGAGAVVKGSIEYAVAELQVPLIMVLGHSGCGAVKAAVKHIDGQDALPGAIEDLVKLVRPAVERSKDQRGDRLDNAIRANVAIGVERIKTLDPVVTGPLKAGHVKVVGATYDLRSGRVDLIA